MPRLCRSMADVMAVRRFIRHDDRAPATRRRAPRKRAPAARARAGGRGDRDANGAADAGVGDHERHAGI